MYKLWLHASSALSVDWQQKTATDRKVEATLIH